MASVRCHGDRCFGLPRLASPGVSWTTHYQVELPPDVIQWPQDQTLVGQKSWKMRRARGLLLRLAAAASRPAPAQGFIDASQAAAVGGRPQATAGAAGAATVCAAAAACSQWGLAEAQQPQQAQQQQETAQQPSADCPECGDIQLGDQPVAVINSATAQVRAGARLAGPTLLTCICCWGPSAHIASLRCASPNS